VILLDTNVISELMRTEPEPSVLGWLDEQLESELHFCAVTKAEIELGIAQLPEGKRKQRLAEAATLVLDAFEGRCLDYDCTATPHYVSIAKHSWAAGRPMSIEDMLIAATALAHGCLLATRNVTDFDFLPKLELVNPWEAS